MGQMRGYFLRCRGAISVIGLVAIALFTVHALSSLVFAVLGLAPSSPQWGLALTLGSFLAIAGAAAGLPRLPQRLARPISGAFSIALLGFYTVGQLTGQQASWAITGAVLGLVVGGGLGFASGSGFWRVAIALTSSLCAYGAAFGFGSWALAAIGVQRWGLALGLGLLTGLYLWFTRQALGMAYRKWCDRAK
ncbi:MAG: hypothetical protein AAFU84_06945 [Cyanobacteria bacterium J06633_23]